MKRPPELTKLIDVLDRLFDTEAWSRAIVARANIEDGKIVQYRVTMKVTFVLTD